MCCTLRRMNGFLSASKMMRICWLIEWVSLKVIQVNLVHVFTAWTATTFRSFQTLVYLVSGISLLERGSMLTCKTGLSLVVDFSCAWLGRCILLLTSCHEASSCRVCILDSASNYVVCVRLITDVHLHKLGRSAACISPTISLNTTVEEWSLRCSIDIALVVHLTVLSLCLDELSFLASYPIEMSTLHLNNIVWLCFPLRCYRCTRLIVARLIVSSLAIELLWLVSDLTDFSRRFFLDEQLILFLLDNSRWLDIEYVLARCSSILLQELWILV